MANAFLSTADSHLRLPYPSDGLARHYAEQAEIEARAILAVTEPGSKCWGFLPFPVVHPWRNGSGRIEVGCERLDADERKALAESLEAFIND